MPVQEVKRLKQPDSLILNSPYREPDRYWKYDRKHREFVLIEGERRKAGYVRATMNTDAFDDPGEFIPIDLVNSIRTRVKKWRQADYPGITGTTRRLLLHWHDDEQRPYPLFFCQLEAMETIIWLTEAAPSDQLGVIVPGDGGPFTRHCTKLATGGGKTIVMAMTIAWQVLNKAANPRDKRFSKNILIIAPGLTVKSRLSVLIPDHPDGDYYEEFGIIPPGMMPKLRTGSVLVHNWHKLDWDTDEQIKKKKTVDKRGAKSDEAYVRSVFKDGLPINASNIVVINDEAHHAWRIPKGVKITGLAKSDKDEATKWVGGLDRIHKARGINIAFDFSATPFVPTGKKSGDEQLFGWIVSDFGLNDAIESGLVKTPRIVVRDDSTPDAKTFRPKLYHIYRHVKDDLNRKAEPQEPLPDLITNAYMLLGKDWLETAQNWNKSGHTVPPVMITVANRTETAARLKYAFDHRKIMIAELCDPEKTLHIDSKVLDAAEAQDEPSTVNKHPSRDDDDAPLQKLTKKQQAELLRQKVDTVGRPGLPGADIQNVISVGMLSEGWDAKTVTHIMGLRAFSSQLLCEQVVGRGLRRTSYDVDEASGLFKPEYVNVFGVPFSFMPHESDDSGPPPPPPPRTEIRALPEREAEYAIRWPNVIKIEPAYRHQLDIDLSKMDVLPLNAANVARLAEIAPTVDNKPDFRQISEIDLEEIAHEFRFQKVSFEAARNIFDQMQSEWKGSPDELVVQLMRLVERFLQSDKLTIDPLLFYQDLTRRRIILALCMNQIVQHLYAAIREQNILERDGHKVLRLIFDDERPVLATGDMRTWYTAKPCEKTTKSHINECVYDSAWEATHAFAIDRSDLVSAWAKNDHLGFYIWYIYNGARKRYFPDFLIRMASGDMLVLETKGQNNAENRAKRKALIEWIDAVNTHAGFGHWTEDIALSPGAVHDVLDKYSLKTGTQSAR